MVLAFAACGNDGKAVEEYVKRSETGIITAFNSDGSGQYGDVSITNEGTKVVIECRFKEEAPEDAAENVEKGFESTDSLLKEAFSKMQEEEPAVSALVVRYLDENGEVLAEKEIK